MSYKLVDQVIDLDVGDATAKLVLILIARHAHNDGTGCVAGQETLAKMAGCTTRTVYDAMVYLTRTGLIRRRMRFRKDGTRTSDETMLPVDTTGKIFRWSHADQRKKTTPTSGRKRRRPPEESSELNLSVESISGISQRERAQNRNDSPKLDRPREPKPAALSLQAGIEADPELPNRCRTEAATLRPDLTPERVEASVQRWINDRKAKGTVRVDWTADFKGWIGRERVDAPGSAKAYAPGSMGAWMSKSDKPAATATATHASHRIFESVTVDANVAFAEREAANRAPKANGNTYDATATTIDPPAEPPDAPLQIVVDLAAKFTGNAAPATPPATAGTTPEDSTQNDQKRTTPPINLASVLNKRMPRVETEEQRAARMESERLRQVAELRARGVKI